jgi:hypothetical protein
MGGRTFEIVELILYTARSHSELEGLTVEAIGKCRPELGLSRNLRLAVFLRTLVTTFFALALYIGPPHTAHAYGADATHDPNFQLRDTPESLVPTPQYASTQSLDIKATATTYAPTFKKYLYSFILPQPAVSIIGFGGDISITSGTPRFSEALISVHYSPSGHCPSDGAVYDTYDQIGHDFPDSGALGQFILKLPAAGHAQLSTKFALPAAIAVKGCIFVILDGGIAGAGGPFTMTSAMSLAYTAQQPSSSATSLSLDDEFCLGQSSGCQLATEKASARTAFAKVLKVTRPSILKALYGDISDSALGRAGYAPPPTGSWSTWNDFYIYKGCIGISEGTTGPADYYASIPPDAIRLLSLKQQGRGDAVVQRIVYKRFNIQLNTGDCLVHFLKGNPNGGMSAEAQVFALIQPKTAPIGNLDSITPSGLVSGWALDPDTPTTPINVHFYLDSPSGQSAFVGFTSANISRPDVNQVTGYPGDHGFSFQLPSSVSNGNHTLYVYGIDGAGAPNAILGGASKTVTISISGGVGEGSPR